MHAMLGSVCPNWSWRWNRNRATANQPKRITKAAKRTLTTTVSSMHEKYDVKLACWPGTMIPGYKPVHMSDYKTIGRDRNEKNKMEPDHKWPRKVTWQTSIAESKGPNAKKVRISPTRSISVENCYFCSLVQNTHAILRDPIKNVFSRLSFENAFRGRTFFFLLGSAGPVWQDIMLARSTFHGHLWFGTATFFFCFGFNQLSCSQTCGRAVFGQEHGSG